MVGEEALHLEEAGLRSLERLGAPVAVQLEQPYNIVDTTAHI